MLRAASTGRPPRASHRIIAVPHHAKPLDKAFVMTNIEEQQLIHGVAGLAQGVHALLKLFGEINEQRKKADEEMINLLKLISRKH